MNYYDTSYDTICHLCSCFFIFTWIWTSQYFILLRIGVFSWLSCFSPIGLVGASNCPWYLEVFPKNTWRIQKPIYSHPSGAADLCLDWSAQQGNNAYPNTQVLGHLSYSLGQYKESLMKFAEQLNEPGYERTSDSYTASFGRLFQGEPTLSLVNPDQCFGAVCVLHSPRKDEAAYGFFMAYQILRWTCRQIGNLRC